MNGGEQFRGLNKPVHLPWTFSFTLEMSHLNFCTNLRLFEVNERRVLEMINMGTELPRCMILVWEIVQTLPIVEHKWVHQLRTASKGAFTLFGLMQRWETLKCWNLLNGNMTYLHIILELQGLPNHENTYYGFFNFISYTFSLNLPFKIRSGKVSDMNTLVDSL